MHSPRTWLLTPAPAVAMKSCGPRVTKAFHFPKYSIWIYMYNVLHFKCWPIIQLKMEK